MDPKYLKSILLMTVSSLSFALMSLMVRLAGDLPLFEKVLFRNLFSLLIAILIILKEKGSFSGKKENRKYLILRGLSGLGGVMLYFYSLSHLNLSDATMLNKMSPFFVIIFASLFLKERMNRYQIAGICVAFLASLLIIKPHFDLTLLPSLLGLGSAFFAGFAYTVIRLLKLRGESSGTIVFYFSLVSFIIVLPLALINYTPPSALQWLYLLGIGFFAAFGQLFMTQAYFYARASDIAPYKYLHVLFAALIGLLFLGESMDILSIVGSGIIILVFIYLYKKRCV
ncbi:MAG: DMT family transporter [Candidatus Neomarinimicrobiota bacterium]|jgi:drug/metabolite transporter (DMT)-like permease|nr:DMT family transporter [Candidatus Neomarinimicrobiota bacterium]